MTVTPRSVTVLIDELKRLPSIGPKTAARLTYFLLKSPDNLVFNLAKALLDLKKKTTICQECFNVAESNPCPICSDSQRDHGLLCVVEEPLDVLAIEKTGKYQGVYHVLGGVINPMAGIGPGELQIKELFDRMRNHQYREVIFAMNPSLEGDATAMYLRNKMEEEGLINSSLQITKLARGLPTGADLEYADPNTLGRSLEGRNNF